MGKDNLNKVLCQDNDHRADEQAADPKDSRSKYVRKKQPARRYPPGSREEGADDDIRYSIQNNDCQDDKDEEVECNFAQPAKEEALDRKEDDYWYPDKLDPDDRDKRAKSAEDAKEDRIRDGKPFWGKDIEDIKSDN